jgi:hypothetical protein
MFLAGGTDVLASTFGLSFEALLRAFQISLLVVPAVTGYVTWRIFRELGRQRVHPIQQPVGGTIVRTPTGGYEIVGGEEEDAAS